ncbi:pentatricopeptide repeat-containing protein At2g13420, mitochondrial-like [Lycium ferocissimum]|uniref:pentatricopeptide repeat-containing protein At2g13420, mitochondrial-like n=1 Tax=Lycium ferocissimum TaxID=112874 RepID=UPI0028166E36|nr:pentatricopeptide repeat-containing protein At2g13420, mitochondrial-like [Lycium ferocissimum]XP_059297011.1 pentatricopeptide repeat-containing protein At2g13420, mitochondrial-like [Lycium ferocissimum]XP_059297012.1 pentatricopeptide repeat-containing protein At2g13420, mitochondrial-like [Lycium ferocissimum]
MLVRFHYRSLFFAKTPVTSLRYFCSSRLHSIDQTPSLPQLEPSNDADLISQLLLQHHNPFHAMESSLQLNGISFTPFLINQTLLRLKHNSKIALSFFHYSQNYPLDTTAFNILIDILCKVHQFDVAWQLIVQMETKSVKINFTTFYLLIRRLIGSGLTRQAIRAFSEMHVFLDESEDVVWKCYFCYLLDTLCKYGYVKVATEVFNKEKWRLELNCKVYTILIYGWCKLKNIDRAKRFFDEMLDKGIDPNVVSYNVLLNGICRRASLHPDGRSEKVIRDAEKVFDEMSERGVEPDVTSYSILLHVYSRAHKPELALEKLRVMRHKGICPNIVTYTSVIKCLCSCGRIEDAELLLEQMVSNGVTPTSVTYNCFFKEFKGRKDVDGALRLYGKMKEGSFCEPSVSTFNILLGMLLKFGRIGVARDIWDDMKDSGAGPDLDSYTLLIHGFCEKQKWKTACEFFMEMIEKGFLPQKVTFETLYRGLIQANMLRTWRRLKKRLDEESITFGSEFENYHLKPYRR